MLFLGFVLASPYFILQIFLHCVCGGVCGCTGVRLCVWHCYDIVAVVGYVQRHLVSASVVLVVVAVV